MKFNASFSSSLRETIFHMLTGLSRLNDCEICAVILKDVEGMELCAVTDSAAAFGKILPDHFISFNVTSKNNNKIAAEVQLAGLLAAFEGTAGGDEVTLKLTKDSKNDIFLSISGRTISQITVKKDVPVLRLLPEPDTVRYTEPLCSQAFASVNFPDIRAAKKVLDRMKQLDKVIIVKVHQQTGRLVFRVDNEVVSTRSIFKNLAIDQSDNTTACGNEYFVAALSSKELASITAGLGTFGKRSSSVVLAVAKGTLVCIHVTFDDDSSLTYYLATSMSDEDMQPSVGNDQLLRDETVRGEDVPM